MTRSWLLGLALVLSGSTAPASTLPPPDPDNGAILLPPGFRALVFADNLVAGQRINDQPNRLRFIAVAPNGDVYAKTRRGGLLALRDTDGDGRADVVKTFGEGGGTGLMLRDGWLYHSTDKDVYRYKYTPGELVPSGVPERIVADLPNQRTHDAKAFFFDDQNRLYVETGVPSNAYGGKNDRRLGATGSDATEFLQQHGGFWRYDADQPEQTRAQGYQFSRGHRHVVGVAWHPIAKSAFFVMHGRDNLHDVAPQHYSIADGAELPAEEFHQLREGMDLGWPYTYYDPMQKARMVAPEFGGDGRKRDESGKYADPLIAFPAHWAPLQMAYYGATQFPEKYRHGLFVAFHGSWNRAPLAQRGYNITFIPFTPEGQPTGDWEIFADGFAGSPYITASRQARFRPGGVAVGPDGSLYISETEKGRIWRIFYVGENAPVPPATAPTLGATRAAAAPATPATAPSLALNARGKLLYDSLCASCHMPDGSGVSGLQPALTESAIVRGDATRLLRVIAQGPAAVLPADRPKYSNVMPGFGPAFTDQQLADLGTYLRQRFGDTPTAAPLTAADAKSAR